MPVKDVINDGIGFFPGKPGYIVTRGLLAGVTPPPPTPGAGPVNNAIGGDRAGFTTYNSVVVVSPLGQNTLAYVARTDSDQIAAVDTVTPAPVDFAIYYAHSFTGQDQHRSLRKKIVRFNVYGKGEISGVFGSAYMVIVADQSRTDVYPFSDQSPYPVERMLWRQNTLALTGHVFDVCLFLTGAGIEAFELEFQYSVVG